jgi:Putative citrate transport
MHTTLLEMPLMMGLPFLITLPAIAALPLAVPHFRQNNKNQLIVALGLSVPFLAYFIARHEPGRITETLVFDDLPFIILLGSLSAIPAGPWFSLVRISAILKLKPDGF